MWQYMQVLSKDIIRTVVDEITIIHSNVIIFKKQPPRCCSLHWRKNMNLLFHSKCLFKFLDNSFYLTYIICLPECVIAYMYEYPCHISCSYKLTHIFRHKEKMYHSNTNIWIIYSIQSHSHFCARSSFPFIIQMLMCEKRSFSYGCVCVTVGSELKPNRKKINQRKLFFCRLISFFTHSWN